MRINGSTLSKIKDLVNMTKDFDKREMLRIANALPTVVCSLYVLHMQNDYKIKINI